MNTSGRRNWIDELFQKKLSDFEMSPQASVINWTNLKEDLVSLVTGGLSC
jgi:hypothetical protein